MENATTDLDKALIDLKSSAWVDRQLAVDALKTHGGDAVLPHLEKVLADENPWVRVAAAEALVHLQGAAATATIARYLDNETEPQAALRVLEALGRIGDARALDTMHRRLGDAHPLVAATAAWGLGRLASAPSDWEALAEASASAPAWETREQAVIALGKSGLCHFRTALERALHDKKNAVRREAAQALGRLGDPGAVAALRAALEDRDWRVRETAKDSLAALQKA